MKGGETVGKSKDEMIINMGTVAPFGVGRPGLRGTQRASGVGRGGAGAVLVQDLGSITQVFDFYLTKSIYVLCTLPYVRFITQEKWFNK